MPSGLRKTTGNHFEIYYEQPWGGVASNANPVDIQPNQLVSSNGTADIEGELNYVSISAAISNFAFNPHTANAFITVIWTMGGLLYCLDQFGNIYNNTIPASGFQYAVTAADGPWTPASTGVTLTPVKVINGSAYISVPSRNSIYVFTAPTTFVLGSNYSGGAYLGILDNYLLQLNVNSSIDGLQPNRISWSGPGLFTTWNPALNRTAGFNTLSSIDDELVGFLSLASVGIAISAKSLIELSPTGVGIGPFQFTTLWTSVIGKGSIYPQTITQFGQLGLLATDSGIYSITTGGGMTDVSGTASASIYESFQVGGLFNLTAASVVSAGILLYFYNNPFPTPFYVLAAKDQIKVPFVNVWLMNLATGAWYQTTFNFALLCNIQNGTTIPANGGAAVLQSISVYTMQPVVTTTVMTGNAFTPITLITYILTYLGVNYTTTAQFYAYSAAGMNMVQQVAGNLNLVFRAEEVKLGRDPTIRRVLVKAYGSGTLNISVNGTSFGSVILDGTNTAKTYKSPLGMYTGEAPQTSITATNFKGSIVKVMLAGTYADGDID